MQVTQIVGLTILALCFVLPFVVVYAVCKLSEYLERRANNKFLKVQRNRDKTLKKLSYLE
jgi:hypothetical protein